MDANRGEPHAHRRDIKSIKANVKRVIIDGLSRTKDDLVTCQVQDVLKATNFEEMTHQSVFVKQKLQDLGVFRNVAIVFDTSKAPGADKHSFDVIFKVTEKRLISGGVTTDVEPAKMKTGLTGRMLLNNVMGRAESLAAEYSSDFKNRKEYFVTYKKPLKGNPKCCTSLGTYHIHADYPHSGYSQTSVGVKTDLNFPSFGSTDSHTIQWDGVWRDLRALSRTTSFAVREQAGHSVKSSIMHTYANDTRNDKILPSSGIYTKLSQEYAGLGGNTEFVKANAELQGNTTLPFGMILQLSMAGGVMSTISKDKNISICDRFFLGGPLTLRGFDINGVGPQSDGNFLGSDTYWLSAAHLYTSLPFRPGQGSLDRIFKTHFFVNAGNQGNIGYDKTLKENFTQLLEHYRLACGAGLVLRLGGIARLELNYVYPIKYQQTDSVRPGLQFGVGISFF